MLLRVCCVRACADFHCTAAREAPAARSHAPPPRTVTARQGGVAGCGHGLCVDIAWSHCCVCACAEFLELCLRVEAASWPAGVASAWTWRGGVVIGSPLGHWKLLHLYTVALYIYFHVLHYVVGMLVLLYLICVCEKMMITTMYPAKANSYVYYTMANKGI